MSNRVFKKISTPFDQFKPTGAILMINLYDPQINTIRVFLDAIESASIPYFLIGNKTDLIDKDRIMKISEEIGIDFIPTCLLDDSGIDKVKRKIVETFKSGDRIAILGIFNTGKTSLTSKLTNLDLKIGDLPGTTLEFTEYKYKDYTLIDTVGQVIDVNKPMMVSIDFSGCRTTEEKIRRALREDANGILATLEIAIPNIKKVVNVLKKQIESGHKAIVIGAGASALVAMEMAGQGLETGIPIIAFTNNLSDSYPVSFAKGIAEEEIGLSRYINFFVNRGDVLIGVSASGGTGFVYESLNRARKKGAITVAITENPDTPLGKNADYIIKSNAKPEGPSSSKIQVAHFAIAHSLVLTLADERGVTADQSIKFMLPERVPTKKMGIK